MMASPASQFGASSFDQLQTNLMTMSMFQTSTGSGNYFSSIMAMIYIFILGQIMKLAPQLFREIKTYLEKYFQQKATSIIQSKTTSFTKSASIALRIDVGDVANCLCQALLNYATLHTNTKHIKYTNNIYMLNDTSVISIGKDMFIQLVSEENVKLDPNNNNTNPQSDKVQNIDLFSYSKSASELRAFLDTISTQYTIDTQANLGIKRYYFNMQPVIAPPLASARPGEMGVKDYTKMLPFFTFNMRRFQTNRKFSNLFGENIAAIRKRVQFFMNNEDWYNQKGIPYTLGLLLSGPPGTGKTSCIKCLANETDRHIININMNSDITKKQIENLFFDEEIRVLTNLRPEIFRIPLDKRIYVFEDVDCQGDVVLERGDQKKPGGNEPVSEKMDMSFLLNILDGILETPGRIIIMTSNFADRLDKALVRPGRIDIISEFGRCENSTIVEMIEYFKETKLSEEDCSILMNLPYGLVTPAELSKLLFEHMHEPVHRIISELEQFRLKPSASKVEQIQSNVGESIKTNQSTGLPSPPEQICSENKYAVPPEQICSENKYYAVPPEQICSENKYAVPPEQICSENQYAFPTNRVHNGEVHYMTEDQKMKYRSQLSKNAFAPPPIKQMFKPTVAVIT